MLVDTEQPDEAIAQISGAAVLFDTEAHDDDAEDAHEDAAEEEGQAVVGAAAVVQLDVTLSAPPTLLAELAVVVAVAALQTVELPAVAVAVALAQPGIYEGEYVDVPLYCGQPGTSVLGGAVPPPQSRKSQSSPVPGTYQARLAPAGEETSVEVQPVRSVRARARVARQAGRRKKEENMVDGFVLIEVVVMLSDCWNE